MVKNFKDCGVAICCRLLSLNKSTYYDKRLKNENDAGQSFEKRYGRLKRLLEKVISDNPSYGYRRIKKELEEKYRVVVNHKPLKKLLKLWGLSLRRTVNRPKKSGICEILAFLGVKANLIKTLELVKPFRLIFADITELTYENGKLYLAAYLDCLTKTALSWELSENPDGDLISRAYQKAKKGLKRFKSKLKKRVDDRRINENESENKNEDQDKSAIKTIFHQDQGSVFTSYAYVDRILKDGFALSYSRKGTPSDNPEMESFFSRFKSENKQFISQLKTRKEVEKFVKKQMMYYNQKRRHSCLGNISPNEFIKRFII